MTNFCLFGLESCLKLFSPSKPLCRTWRKKLRTEYFIFQNPVNLKRKAEMKNWTLRLKRIRQICHFLARMFISGFYWTCFFKDRNGLSRIDQRFTRGVNRKWMNELIKANRFMWMKWRRETIQNSLLASDICLKSISIHNNMTTYPSLGEDP